MHNFLLHNLLLNYLQNHNGHNANVKYGSDKAQLSSFWFMEGCAFILSSLVNRHPIIIAVLKPIHSCSFLDIVWDHVPGLDHPQTEKVSPKL